MLRTRLVATLAATVLTLAGSARADFTLSLTPDGPLTPGGTVAVDIRASDPNGTMPLAFYDLTLVVSGSPVSPSFFVPTDPKALVQDPNYVFFGDSASDPVNPGTVTTPMNSPPNTQVEVTDSTLNGDEQPLSSSTLLSRVFIQVPSLTPVGESVTLTLTKADLESNSVSFGIVTPMPSITITVRAVPEPGSLALLATGAGAFALAMRRKRNRASAV